MNQRELLTLSYSLLLTWTWFNRP